MMSVGPPSVVGVVSLAVASAVVPIGTIDSIMTAVNAMAMTAVIAPCDLLNFKMIPLCPV
jgi:hypothetical protein